LDIDQLRRMLERNRPAFLYTIPNFQNPTGVTTSQAHREKLLALCEEHRLPLVEDGFEEEMKYFGKVSLPIKSMDRQGVVIYLGTFSKVLFPGVRVGWIIARRECVRRLMAIKRFTDISSSGPVQAALHEFCRREHFDLHVRRMHRVFRRRMQVALEAMREHLPARRVAWSEPTGGYLIWVRLRGGVDEERFHRLCAEHRTSVAPGGYFFPEAAPDVHFRISISMLDEAEIRAGIERLGRAVRALGR
jgi:DNA-binding transcriptional MocR family regulator